MWDGTDSTSFGHVEKIVDYAGTESLQLTTSAGSAELQMRFDDSVNAISTTIQPNTWYDVTMFFNSQGHSVVGGNLDGMVSLIVNSLGRLNVAIVISDVRTEAQRWLIILRFRSDSFYTD